MTTPTLPARLLACAETCDVFSPDQCATLIDGIGWIAMRHMLREAAAALSGREAVANESLDAQGLCHKSGSPEWPWNCDCPNHARTTTPAPVDVRKLLSVVARMESYATDQENDPILIPPSRIRSWASDIRAILDCQPAMVDDAMVRSAVNAYDEWMIEHAPDETDAYHAGMRAALQAALGGGGGRG